MYANIRTPVTKNLNSPPKNADHAGSSNTDDPNITRSVRRSVGEWESAKADQAIKLKTPTSPTKKAI